jgi:hypothetical protein
MLYLTYVKSFSKIKNKKEILKMRIIKGKHNFGDGEVYSVTATELKHMDRIVSYGTGGNR